MLHDCDRLHSSDQIPEEGATAEARSSPVVDGQEPPRKDHIRSDYRHSIGNCPRTHTSVARTRLNLDNSLWLNDRFPTELASSSLRSVFVLLIASRRAPITRPDLS